MTLIYIRVNKPTWDNKYAVGTLSAVTHKTKWEPKIWVYEDWVLLKVQKV